ncbi:helix-turn-helix domain-containing protein [Microbacterium foliorum]|uniref:Helix-turn-helix domain protein n=2 Tax=Microbacterium foliorum TaxID=104336 RepID=A0A0F0KJM1_9MICO|nr:helix-turn-helix domain-containing protein [Microbacterium foliorum]KJL21097.1 Helix-turn-helix domain protein [Microbacterium foliorum]
MSDPLLDDSQVGTRSHERPDERSVKLAKFRAVGRQAILNAKPARSYGSPTNVRFTEVADENAAVRADLVRIGAYMFAHVQLPAGRLVWTRDGLSQHQVVVVATESPGLEVVSEGPVVARRATWFVVAPGRTPVQFTAARPLELVFVNLDRSRIAEEMDVDLAHAGRDTVDDGVVRPMVNFVKSLCAIQGEKVETGATPLGGAACEVARSLVKTVVGDPVPETSLTDAVIGILRRRHASPHLSVSMVARELGVSVRTIQSALRRERTTFSAALRSIRIDMAKDLQRADPGLGAAAVARAAGFGSRQALYRSVRNAEKSNAEKSNAEKSSARE